MRIAIQFDQPNPFLQAIGKAAVAVGHQVNMWQTNKVNFKQFIQELDPELFIVNDGFNEWNTTKGKPHIVYGTLKPGVADVRLIIPPVGPESSLFFDPISYPSITMGSKLKQDILVSSNFYNTGHKEKTLAFIDKVLNETDYTIRTLGAEWVPSVTFVGIAQDEQFMKACLGSKVVICNHEIERLSLNARKINAKYIDNIMNSQIEDLFQKDKAYLKSMGQDLTLKKKTSINVLANIFKQLGNTEEANRIESMIGNGL